MEQMVITTKSGGYSNIFGTGNAIFSFASNCPEFVNNLID